MTSQIKTVILLALLSGLILFMGQAIGGQGGLIIALIIALALNVGSYWFSDKIVLNMYRAHEITPKQAPELYSMVDELARHANIPTPRVFVIPEEAPNAFATGRNPEHGVVAVTQGIMRILSPAELKGVLAHEIAHIAHRDILIQSIAAVMATVITFLANMAQFAAFFGDSRNREGGNPIAAILMAVLAPIAATIIQFSLSRSREYLADEGGAQFCGHPEDLASALAKLQMQNQTTPMHRNTSSTAHMFIVTPFSASKIAGLFSTHPPIQERINRLLAMRGRV